eukprot:TRINITY_DN9276_c0_g1_i1.p1 TRINITY_DN9276_c0_g1~~TRINITY_DN9276_c0_g1_i1.p1  ORF type:complete len:225 (+),score=43.03 TRINITY_DN9276_c0_g1_i1:93-677(+)
MGALVSLVLILYVGRSFISGGAGDESMYAICMLKTAGKTALQDGQEVAGEIYLHQKGKSHPTTIEGHISGLSSGLHGFHIHEYGDMASLPASCDSAGPHYNPFHHPHGGRADKQRHVGDLGNVLANENGIAEVTISDSVVSLKGEYSVMGRSIVVHQLEDDYGKGGHADSATTGHAGARLACCVISHTKRIIVD